MDFNGLYVGEIAEQGMEFAKSGNPQIVLKTRVLSKVNSDGTYEAVPGAVERTIWMTLTDKTVGFVSKDLQAVGFYGPPSRIQLDGDDPCDIRGKEVKLWCKQETGLDGQQRERWSISRPREARPVTPVTTMDASRIDAAFGDAFSSTPAGETETATPKRVGVPNL
jgi:hypothetical protein